MESPQAGVYTASLTPLFDSFEPNIPALIRHAQWLLEEGSDGVALLGSTGESNSMTVEQRQSIIEQSALELPPDRLMMGTGSCALQDAVRLTQASVNAGVLSVLVLPPFYYKPQSEESVLSFFSLLVEAVDNPNLRIIFYNFPQLSGYNFSIKILQELKLRFGDIAAGIKDSSGDWNNMLGGPKRSGPDGVYWHGDFVAGHFARGRSRLYYGYCKFDCSGMSTCFSSLEKWPVGSCRPSSKTPYGFTDSFRKLFVCL